LTLQTLPGETSDPPVRRTALSSGVVTYTDEGARGAPALVAIHGVPGSGRDFRYLAPQLVGHIRFVRIDLPGFGGSDPSPRAVDTLTGRAEAVGELADLLGLDSFAVLGHSLGGATALTLAARNEARVRLLALVASVGLRRHRGLGMSPGTFVLLARGLQSRLLSRVLLPIARAQYRRRRIPGADEMAAQDFAIHFRAIAAVDFGLLRKAAEGPLPPTLVAYAADDRLVEPRIAEELIRTLPTARVLAFPDGGHNLQKTRAVEVAAAIRSALHC